MELKEVATDTTNEFTKIHCASCEQEIPAEDININDKIAKCSQCNVIFPFHHKVADFLKKKNGKQEMIRPEGVDLFYFKDELDITIQQPIAIIEGVLMAVLPLFLIISISAWSKKGASVVWPAVAAIMNTLFIAYAAIFRNKHKLHIVLDDRFLTIKWRPKKFNTDQSYPIADIDQIYVKASDTYQLYMIVNDLAGQKHIKLIGGLGSMSKARFIEQEIERHLGIENRIVPEEIK